MSNTVKRSIFGIVFIGVMLAGLLLSKFGFAALMLFILVVMMLEFHHMTVGKKFLLCRVLSIITGVILFLSTFIILAFDLSGKYMAVALLPFAVLMAASLYSHDRGDFRDFSHILASVIYIALPLSLSNFVVFDGTEFSGQLMLGFFIIIWASDVGAYIFGISLGQKYGKKLFPEVSPGRHDNRPERIFKVVGNHSSKTFVHGHPDGGIGLVEGMVPGRDEPGFLR